MALRVLLHSRVPLYSTVTGTNPTTPVGY